jgi:hypothetical protein
MAINQHIKQVLQNWIPYKLLSGDDGETLLCQWLYTGDIAFTHPFFDETITACRALPQNGQGKKNVSSMEVLPNWADAVQGVQPSAIIFHISRCGSTLLSQLLSLHNQCTVLSEVPFLDALLRYGFNNYKGATIQPVLQAAIGLYSASGQPGGSHLFIKADSWHLFFYRQLRQLYPTIPFVLLYREPFAVLRSQQKKRGMHAVPGLIEPALFGLDKEKVVYQPFDEYMADVLERYMQTMLNITATDTNILLANYAQGALPIVQKIAAMTQLSITPAQLIQMQQRTTYHAKEPGQVFAESALQQVPPAYLQTAVNLYQQLEELRSNKIA